MKNLRILLAFFVMGSSTIFVASCKKDSTNPPPVAIFTFTGDNNPAPCAVTFSNSSTNAKSYNWTFGDGSTSTEQNPQHTYTTGGTFNVILVATGIGGSNSTNKSVTILFPVPGANFTFTGTNNPAPCVVTFTSNSTNSTSYLWDFGDGTQTSTLQNPQHTYTTGGTFNVQLTATGVGGSNSITKSVTILYSAPVANFTFSGANNPAPCTVAFTNTSTNSTSYLWDFGDGTQISTVQNPQHIYTTGGTFNVHLIATGAGGSNSITKNVTILYSAPVANFTFSGANNPAPCLVTFTNTSTNATSYYWNFGDGGTSIATNPQYTYTTSGTFNVQLTASNAGGSNSITKSVIIQNPILGTNVTFNNPIFTDIYVTLNGTTLTITPGGSVTFLSVMGSSVSYSAYTYGVAADGTTQIGLELDWNYTINLPGGNISFNLGYNNNLFFLDILNVGTHILTPLYVNYGLYDETMDNILIPNDDILYSTGYYDANSNTEVLAYYQDDPTSYTDWINTIDFTFPGTDNQYVELVNTSKSLPKINGTHSFVLNPKLLKPAKKLILNTHFDKKTINVYCNKAEHKL